MLIKTPDELREILRGAGQHDLPRPSLLEIAELGQKSLVTLITAIEKFLPANRELQLALVPFKAIADTMTLVIDEVKQQESPKC